MLGCGVIGNTEDSGSFVSGSSPGIPAIPNESFLKIGTHPIYVDQLAGIW